MTVRTFVVVALLFLAPVVDAVPVHAQATGSGPVDAVRTRNEEVKRILVAAGEPVDAATRERLKDVINGLLDFDELSRRALGRHWDARTDQEKRDFVRVFQQLIRNSSVKKLGAYRSDSVRYEQPTIDDEFAMLTTIVFKNGKSAEVVYHLHLVGGEWLAYDIVVDGSSTARTYRDSFNRQIQKTSYQEMYDKLVERLAKDGVA